MICKQHENGLYANVRICVVTCNAAKSYKNIVRRYMHVTTITTHDSRYVRGSVQSEYRVFEFSSYPTVEYRARVGYLSLLLNFRNNLPNWCYQIMQKSDLIYIQPTMWYVTCELIILRSYAEVLTAEYNFLIVLNRMSLVSTGLGRKKKN